MNRISAEMLVERKACDAQVDEFRRRFPDGVTFESEADAIAQCVAVADVFGWTWASVKLLSGAAWEAYDEAVASARKAYDEATDTTQKAHDEALAAAFAREFWRMGE